MPKGAAGFFIFGKSRDGEACRSNQCAEACHVIMSRTGSYALETSGDDHLLSTAIIGGMDKLVDENGPRRKD
ncbi:hypothetical protein [Mesorhizobium escarrei]|uniref:hypothetical protein n=1 Tax=Mesorhizobium escarrei TaxID=666018 RepID=UPI0020A7A8CF|nr:hypothetical protein [Mesorhizobium escarrei]